MYTLYKFYFYLFFYQLFDDILIIRPAPVYTFFSVLDLIRAATGSQCKETKRGVICALLGSLKTSRALHSESFVEV